MREFLMPADPLVSNVSDTARWVAAYRAMESARPDALFRDPYADRLAGARGHAIGAAQDSLRVSSAADSIVTAPTSQ
jgi:O-methyltransferase involved in polyketide biosynthesis